jgi:hypothetical protein
LQRVSRAEGGGATHLEEVIVVSVLLGQKYPVLLPHIVHDLFRDDRGGEALAEPLLLFAATLELFLSVEENKEGGNATSSK